MTDLANQPSLREITYQTSYNKNVGMLIASGAHGKTIFVEGVSDKNLYWRLLDTEFFHIQSVSQDKNSEPSAKSKVIECVVQQNRRRLDSCLGIVDQDYDSFQPSFSSYPVNVFSTDQRDSECMMLHTEAFEAMYAEWFDENKCKGQSKRNMENIREILCQLALPVGLLRLLNDIHGWRISFREIPWDKFVDKSKWSINVSDLITFLVEMPTAGGGAKPSVRGITETLLSEKYAEALPKYSSIDPWRICRGHDVIDLFIACFSRGKQNHKNAHESNLRSGYTPELFSKTKLSNAIECFMNPTRLSIVKPA